jgi:hypothetical protein
MQRRLPGNVANWQQTAKSGDIGAELQGVLRNGGVLVVCHLIPNHIQRFEVKMPYGNGSEEEIEQRRNAAKKHGAYAFRDRGEQALEPTGRTRLAELREQVQDHDGLLSLMQEKAADSVLLFELLQSYVAEEVKNGAPLGEIAALNKLPAFFNSMQRALTGLIALMPASKDEAMTLELDRIRAAVEVDDDTHSG